VISNVVFVIEKK